MVVVSTILIIGIALCTPFAYQFYGIDSLINCYCLMLSFKVLDYQFNKLCKCCIHCSIKYGNKIHDDNIIILKTGSSPSNNQNHNGEITQTTINQSNHIEITQITETQNEGRTQLNLVNSDSIFDEFETMKNSKESNNNNDDDISYSSKIQQKNDSLIVKDIHENEIIKHHITKGGMAYETPL